MEPNPGGSASEWPAKVAVWVPMERRGEPRAPARALSFPLLIQAAWPPVWAVPVVGSPERGSASAVEEAPQVARRQAAQERQARLLVRPAWTAPLVRW